jgi:hypothetical protein
MQLSLFNPVLRMLVSGNAALRALALCSSYVGCCNKMTDGLCADQLQMTLLMSTSRRTTGDLVLSLSRTGIPLEALTTMSCLESST